MQKKKDILGIMITIFGGALWGISGASGQYLFQHSSVSAKWMVPIRLIIAGASMLIFFIITQRKKAFEVWKCKRNSIDIIIYGIFGMMLCQYTYFSIIEYSSAGIATILQYIAPVIIMIIMCFKQKKLPYISEVIAMIFAVLGVFLIATHGSFTTLSISKNVLFMGLCSAGAVVIYNIQPGNLMKQFKAPLIISWAMLIGGIVLSLIFKPWDIKVHIDFTLIIILIVIILLGTILSFSFYMEGVKLIGPTRASLYGSVEPFVAAILSTVWLKTPVTIIDIIGFMFVISTIFILSLKKA
ncbi:DMT family transporter [Clostridium sp. BJN0001]|uniref:DMT family transporter n=1 Tax=Clostridium sp. BJN0001 TaxID=2930219 RepID=UPI001FD08FB8|nr:DMT family transporter [Clostridium sp. BJN0001]